MKKLLLDSFTETVFSFDNVLYEQCDGISVGSSLGPVLANIILTDQNLGTRIKEHCGLDKSSPIFHHLAECNLYQYTLTLRSFPCDGDVTLTNQDILEHIRTTVTNNMRIIGKAENWAELCFLESLIIKWKTPSRNTAIKGTKELVSFS